MDFISYKFSHNDEQCFYEMFSLSFENISRLRRNMINRTW